MAAPKKSVIDTILKKEANKNKKKTTPISGSGPIANQTAKRVAYMSGVNSQGANPVYQRTGLTGGEGPITRATVNRINYMNDLNSRLEAKKKPVINRTSLPGNRFGAYSLPSIGQKPGQQGNTTGGLFKPVLPGRTTPQITGNPTQEEKKTGALTPGDYTKLIGNNRTAQPLLRIDPLERYDTTPAELSEADADIVRNLGIKRQERQGNGALTPGDYTKLIGNNTNAQPLLRIDPLERNDRTPAEVSDADDDIISKLGIKKNTKALTPGDYTKLIGNNNAQATARNALTPGDYTKLIGNNAQAATRNALTPGDYTKLIGNNPQTAAAMNPVSKLIMNPATGSMMRPGQMAQGTDSRSNFGTVPMVIDPVDKSDRFEVSDADDDILAKILQGDEAVTTEAPQQNQAAIQPAGNKRQNNRIGKNFKEWSENAVWSDPYSKFNQTKLRAMIESVSTEEEKRKYLAGAYKNDPELEQAYSDLYAIALQDKWNNAYENPGSWAGGYTEEVKNALASSRSGIDLAIEEKLINEGYYNSGNDIGRMNKEGRAKARSDAESRIEIMEIIKDDLTQQEKDIDFMHPIPYEEYVANLPEGEEPVPEESYGEYWIDTQLEKQQQIRSQIKSIDANISYYKGRISEANRYDKLEENYGLITDTGKRSEKKQNILDERNSKMEEKERWESILSEIFNEEDALDDIDLFYEKYNQYLETAGENAMDEFEFYDYWQDDIKRREQEADDNIRELQREIYEKDEELEWFDTYSILDDDIEDDATYHSKYYYEQFPELREESEGSFAWKYLTGQMAEQKIKARDKELYKNGDEASVFLTKNIHRIVSFINYGEEYDLWLGNRDESNVLTTQGIYSGAMLMLPYEREELTKLYNAAISEGREPTEAKAFFEALQPSLNNRAKPFEDLRIYTAAKQYPILSSGASLAANMFKPVMAAETFAEYVTGDPSARDPNSSLFALERAQSGLENQIANDLGDVGGFGYKAFMSGSKNFLRGITALATGGSAELSTLAQFYAEAFYSSYYSKLDETGDADWTLTYASTDAAISTFFEIASVQLMFNGDMSNYLTYFLTMVGGEMSEELNEGIFSPYIHKLIDGSSQVQDIYNGIRNAGGYTDENGNWIKVDDLNDNGAWEYAWKAYNKQVWEEVMIAGASTFGSFGVGVSRTENSYRQTGQQVRNSGINITDATADQILANKGKNESRILEGAGKMKPGTKSYERAGKIQERLDNGKPVSNRAWGELYSTVISETNEEIGQIVEDNAAAILETKLQGEKDAKELARIVAKSLAGKDLKLSEKYKIWKNDKAKELAREYGAGTKLGLQEDLKKGTERAQSIQDEMLAIGNGTLEQQAAEAKYAAITAGAEKLIATEREIAEAEEENGSAHTGSSTEIIVDGKIQNIQGFKTGEVTDADGNKKNGILVQLDDGTEVPIWKVKTTNERTAGVLQLAQQDTGNMISGDFANTLIKVGENVKNQAVFFRDAMQARLDVFLQRKTGNTTLTSEQLAAIQEQSRLEYEQRDADRIKGYTEIKPGQGKTTYNGKAYGTRQFKEEIAKLSPSVQEEARVIAEVAKAAGFNVEFYYDEKDTANQGCFWTGTGIRINLAGTTDTENQNHKSALAIFGHEGTHWLEANSPAAYKELRSFVLKNLQARGEDLSARLQNMLNIYNNAGHTTDVFDGISEIVARSFEEIMLNEQVVTQLRTQNKKLYGKLKEAVQRIINRIKGVSGTAMMSSHSFAKALRNVSDQMGRLWLNAYEEAKNPQAAAAETETQAKASIRDEVTSEEEAYGRYEQETDSGITVDRQNNIVIAWGKDAAGNTRTQYSWRDETPVEYLLKNADRRIEKNWNEIESLLGVKLSTDDRELLTKTGLTNNSTIQWSNGERMQVRLTDRQASVVQERLKENAEWEEKKESYRTLDENDPDIQYLKAWRRMSFSEMENMLMQKMEKTEGVTPYKAPAWYDTRYHRWIANEIKNGNPEAIMIAAAEMAEMVPDNAVLIPMPNRHGVVNENTDTMQLAQQISKLTGRPVINALAGNERESRKASKDRSSRRADQVSEQDMGFRQIAEIPEGSMPYFIDNLVGTGTTARAAHNAFGKGVTLAYAKSGRAAEAGLKNAGVTYYDKEKTQPVPLSERINMKKTGVAGVKFSIQDEEYMQAVNSGDMDRAQWYVNNAAEKAGYDIENVAYHGSSDFGFTEFNMKRSQEAIFVAYNKETSGTYTKTKNVKQIKDRKVYPNFYTLNNEDFAKFYGENIKDELGTLETLEVRFNEDASKIMGEPSYDIVTRNKKTGEIYEELDDRRSMQKTLKKQFNPNNENEGIYEFYTKPGKQLVVDAEGHYWNDIDFDLYGWQERGDDYRGYYYVPTDYTWDKDFDPDDFDPSQLDLKARTRQIAKWAKAHGYDSVRINNVYDGGPHSDDYGDGFGDIGIFFSKEQVKSADPVTYDDQGNVIPLSERFNTSEPDIRYSLRDGEEIRSEDGQNLAQVLRDGTVVKYSYRSWDEDNENTLYRKLVEAGYNPVSVRKWIHDVNSVAAIIAADRARLDYKADRSQKFKKPNADVYKYTLDASTLCAKRLLYQGTFNEIQKQLPNTPLRPGDLIELANMMHEMGFQTPCGICYVESRRRHTGNAAEQWLSTYQGEYKPNYAELTTTDGLAKLKEEHPQTYKDFIKAMNKRGSGSVKLVQTRTDYRKDLRRMSKEMVDYLNSVGGIRVQSFSDFETPHLIDMMQAVLDMSMKKLKSQGYTKVPNFAWVFGDTGIKINLSLMGEGTGLDSRGRLVFSDTEGMKFSEAMKLRERYSANVGTILVGMNEAHIIAAMGDARIDFIIPFHKSGWSKEEFDKMTTLRNYEDFEAWQNEKHIVGQNEDGSYILKSLDKGENNIMPEEYWREDLDGTQNSRIYLEECAKRGLLPKFSNFLVDNGDGSFSLPTDNSKRSRNIRAGYWKTLIDFKMYDNEGNFAPQEIVKPNFNMQEAFRVLDEYEGGANTLPVAEPVVERYVKWYKDQHRDRTQFSIRDEMDMDVVSWMMSVNEHSLETEAEKELLRQFKDLQIKVDLQREKERNLSERISLMEKDQDKLTQEEKRQLQDLKVRLQNATLVKEQTQEKLGKITGDEGYGRMMQRHVRTFENFVYGKTAQDVEENVRQLRKSAEAIQRILQADMAAVERMKQTDTMKEVQKILEGATLDTVAAKLKRQFNSSWTKAQLAPYIDTIMTKMVAGEEFDADLQQLADILLNSDRRLMYEGLSELNGLTITIGPAERKELRAKHSSLKEIRQRLDGTGIKVRFGEASTLDRDVESLRAEFPTLPELGNDLNALEEFVSWVEGMKGLTEDTSRNEMKAEAMAAILENVTDAMKSGKLYVPKDTKARAQIMSLVEYVRNLNARTTAAEQMLQKIADDVGELAKAGNQASGMAGVLTSHITEALEYFNRTAKIAVNQAKLNRQNALIEQLKSKHVAEMLKSNEQWRQLIERDAKARNVMEFNNRLRNVMDTDIKRLYNLLKAPKATKNIHESVQSLARELIRMYVDNDAALGAHKLLRATRKELAEARRLLDAWDVQDGEFKLNDIYGAFSDDVANVIISDLNVLANDFAKWNANIRGKNKLDTLTQRNEILQEMSDTLAEIYTAIRRKGQVFLNNRQIGIQIAAEEVMVGTRGKKFRELTGRAGSILRALHSAIVSGNMTPEYFFRTLGNEGLNDIWNEYHQAENRNGLELKRAKDRMQEIADKYGFAAWDLKSKIKIPVVGGEVEVTLGQAMSLYATLKREAQLGPAQSEHLAKGGFFTEIDTPDGILGRKVIEKRAHRTTDETMDSLAEQLTEEQKNYVDDVVGYMSNDMSELGNEASMAAYGIRMYKEKYYFPFQIWNGIKNLKSNDAGNGATMNAAFHPSFSKARMHRANNALMIGDFTRTAADHIVGMINYATMGLANENLNKVLNTKISEGETEETETKRNIRAILEEAYGKTALSYLMDLKVQLEGGATRQDRTLGDKVIRIFRKNAVAGSLSVALQQPLSYIRAAMMINPKYLARALNPATWKGSFNEMIKYSGLAAIKQMGRFDVGMGRGAQEYVAPEKHRTAVQKAGHAVTEATTILPELMDQVTWTRMWCAVKLEQQAENQGMDTKSDEFLEIVAERFNDLMRRTQVYDSLLVRSRNMRSTNYLAKAMTSFMAEPTLTANVLMDSLRMAKQNEKGGKAMLAKAAATYVMSAVMQALIKGLFASGRSPDDKKTWLENFLNRFCSYLISEADPLTLIPGYSDLITLMKDKTLDDDAMSAAGKIFSSIEKFYTIISQGTWDDYRSWEDSVGQLTQIFGNVPLKNLMRDGRAIFNWIYGGYYAYRDTDWNVVRQQSIENFWNADNMIGVINKLLKESGYKTSNSAYYQRIYEAKKEGREEDAQDMIDYLLTGKGIKAETVNSGINAAAKQDESASAEEKYDMLKENGYSSLGKYVLEMYADGEISREEAEKMYKEANPKADQKDVLKALDKVDYEKEHGKTEDYTNYTPLKNAIDEDDEKAFKAAKKHLMDNGYKEKDILSTIRSYISERYEKGEISRDKADWLYRKYDPSTDKNERFWMLDRIDYEKATGKEAGGGKYYRLWDAMDANKSTDIQAAVKLMTAHGVEAKNIKSQITQRYKEKYLKAGNSEKVKIRDAIQKAYKALGLTATDADKVINKWK